MNAALNDLPLRFVFSRSLPFAYLRRAFLVVLFGLMIICVGFIIAQLTSVPESSQAAGWQNSGLVLGGILVAIGVIRMIGISYAARFYKEHIVEVDAQGLRVTCQERSGEIQTQALIWNEVIGYAKNTRRRFGFLERFINSSNNDMGHSGGELELVAIIIVVYLKLLEVLVSSSRKTLTFNLTMERSLSFEGFGEAIDDFTVKVLPRFLPDEAV